MNNEIWFLSSGMDFFFAIVFQGQCTKALGLKYVRFYLCIFLRFKKKSFYITINTQFQRLINPKCRPFSHSLVLTVGNVVDCTSMM